MIRKDEASKYYDRNTQVINKGDPGWKSDNHQAGRQGERYGANPTSLIDQKIRQREAREVDLDDLGPIGNYDVGDIVGVVMRNERDVMYFRVVEVTERIEGIGADDDMHTRRTWKYAYTTKNGAL